VQKSACECQPSIATSIGRGTSSGNNPHSGWVCSITGSPLWKQMCLWWPWHWSSSSCRMFRAAFLSRFTVMPWHSLLRQCSTACTLTLRFFGSVSPFHLIILCEYMFLVLKWQS
jgi:hypothetical protein